MSNRGRGRGAGVNSNDRSSSSSSSATSSRSASLTRPTSSSTTTTTTTTIQDNDRLMKQLTTKLGANSASSASLGGASSTTRKFVPNLVASKKDKDKTDSSVNNPYTSNNNASSSNRKDGLNGNRSQTPRGGGPNYRGGHNRGNFQQVEGIFHGNSQIPVGPSSSSSSFGSRMGSSKRENSASDVKLANIKKLGIVKKVVTGDVDGLKYEIDEEYEPRQIPIAERRSIFDVKQEPGVTHKMKEPISASAQHINSFVQLFSQQTLETSTKSIVKDEPIEPKDLPNLQPAPTTNPSELILMQFPDVLPCTRTSSSSSKPELVSLSDLPDGFLGKLQVYKSGKCRLKLNDEIYLDIDIGQPTSFLQNVMVTEMASSTNVNNDQGTINEMNKLVCLGDIKHKLIVSLDVDHVLEDAR